eukprot:1438246-Rhodomonas_salina.1
MEGEGRKEGRRKEGGGATSRERGRRERGVKIRLVQAAIQLEGGQVAGWKVETETRGMRNKRVKRMRKG